MKKIFMWSFLLSLFGCANSESKSDKISLEKIQEMFSNMKNQGIDTDKKMLWGYFFTSNKNDKFEQVINELKKQKFEFVETYQNEDKTYWLHFERIEIHNAKSLYEIDEILYEIAEKYEINYDGFDVGNIHKGKGIERDTYVVPEEFKTHKYQKENFPCLLIGNSAFVRFPHKEEFCFFIKTTISYESKDSFMLPTNQELESFDKLEYFIENNLTQNGIKNYYVFRETYKGFRNFYIVTNNKNGATEVMNLIKNSGDEISFEFEILTDQSWKIYDEFLEKMPVN